MTLFYPHYMLSKTNFDERHLLVLARRHIERYVDEQNKLRAFTPRKLFGFVGSPWVPSKFCFGWIEGVK